MRLAKIKGHVTSTVKHPSLECQRLLIAQPITSEGEPDGPPQIALDPLNTGIHQKVIITSDGIYARQFAKSEQSPARWTVIGIVDPEGSVAL